MSDHEDPDMPEGNQRGPEEHTNRKRKRSKSHEEGGAPPNDVEARSPSTRPPVPDSHPSPPRSTKDFTRTLSRLSTALNTTFTLDGPRLVAPAADLARIAAALDRLEAHSHQSLPPAPPAPPPLPPAPRIPMRSASMSSLAAAAASAARRRSVSGPIPLPIPQPRSPTSPSRGPPSPIASLAGAVAARARKHGAYRVATPPHPPKEEWDPWETARKRMRHVERDDT